MHYHIRHALEHVTVYSYLKDEGTSLEKDIIDCSLGVNPCGVTPTLSKEAYADTFDLIHSQGRASEGQLLLALLQLW